jgi:hypothetical protein
MLQFGGHRQHHRPQRVAGGAKGIGDLLGMPTLMPLSATRAKAALDVELRDDRHDRWQVGLILDVDFGIDQFDVAGRTKPARNVDDAIDLFRRGRGPEGGLVSFPSAWFLAALLELATAKSAGLPVRLPACFVESAAQSLVVFFQARAAALQAGILAFELFDVLLQQLDIRIA